MGRNPRLSRWERVRNMARRLRRNWLVISGTALAALDVVVEEPDWTSALPLIATIALRRFLTPVYDPMLEDGTRITTTKWGKPVGEHVI